MLSAKFPGKTGPCTKANYNVYKNNVVKPWEKHKLQESWKLSSLRAHDNLKSISSFYSSVRPSVTGAGHLNSHSNSCHLRLHKKWKPTRRATTATQTASNTFVCSSNPPLPSTSPTRMHFPNYPRRRDRHFIHDKFSQVSFRSHTDKPTWL